MLPDLRSQAMRDALAAVRDIEDESVRAAALDAFIPHQPSDLLLAAIAAVRDITNESARTRALGALVPHLPPDLLSAALAAIRDITASSRDIFGCSKNRQNRIVENSTYPLDDFGFR